MFDAGDDDDDDDDDDNNNNDNPYCVFRFQFLNPDFLHLTVISF
jgi:hypothetical protein